MFGGEIHNIRFKYFGPSVEAVLDKLPNAEIESAAEDHFVIHAEVFGTGILMWLLSQGSKVEVLSPQAIRDKWLAESKRYYCQSRLRALGGYMDNAQDRLVEALQGGSRSTKTEGYVPLTFKICLLCLNTSMDIL